MTHRSTAPALDLPLPARRELSLALVLVRRMAMAGPDDSRAAMLALDVAGSGFRRLLVLTRCFVVELARSSRRTLTLAPCCATGMTRDEALMIDLLRNADLAKLDRGLATLPEKFREVLVLSCLEGLDHAECAAILKCSPRAIEGRLYRARQQLTAWWDREP